MKTIQKQEKITLALFFTRGVSLKRWDEVGNLSREIALYNELAQHLKRIYFFTYGNQDDLKYRDQLAENIIVVPKKWNLPSFLYMFLLPFVNKHILLDTDILKTNQMKGALAALISKKIYRKPLVVRCGYEWLLSYTNMGASTARLWLIKAVERIVYKGADHIIVSAQNIFDFVQKTFDLTREKMVVVSNYIDIDMFKPLDVHKQTDTVGFVGRLAAQKNLHNLISALEGLDLTLIIFGTGDLKEDLRDHAKSRGVQVEFRGSVPNEQIPSELNKLQVFILPSYFEGNPKVLLEAMACGMPVIATNVVGNQEIIMHKENGFLCETDPDSIRDAIRQVIENPTLKSIMGKGARQTIVESFSLERIIERELAIYLML